jgi:hypothetical protein
MPVNWLEALPGSAFGLGSSDWLRADKSSKNSDRELAYNSRFLLSLAASPVLPPLPSLHPLYLTLFFFLFYYYLVM